MVNTTKVFPARLRGKKRSGGKVELLLIEGQGPRWRALVRGVLRPAELEFAGGLSARLEARRDNGEWDVEFNSEDIRPFLEVEGEMPLPPYIKRPLAYALDRERYQTVFARQEGAVAAPTAGFHFTRELLTRLEAKGVARVEIVLHVGWGTFRPVRTENVEDHRMLPERYEVTAPSADRLNEIRRGGGRIVAVGTTAVRTLETVCDAQGRFQGGSGEASLFIFPGYRFRGVDALVTNFHLPDSTPLLLANAFHQHLLRKERGTEGPPPAFSLRPAYEQAIQKGFRFYSYGDAMMIQ